MKIGLFTGVLDIITHQNGASKSCSSEVIVAHHFVPIDTIIMHVVIRDKKSEARSECILRETLRKRELPMIQTVGPNA